MMKSVGRSCSFEILIFDFTLPCSCKETKSLDRKYTQCGVLTTAVIDRPLLEVVSLRLDSTCFSHVQRNCLSRHYGGVFFPRGGCHNLPFAFRLGVC